MSAVLSDDGLYRYRLDRGGDNRCLWIMLNPSTADAEQDDPTIRKCRGFSERWGYDGFTVVNLYAYRATKPVDLPANEAAAVGRENDRYLAEALAEQEHFEGRVVVAWGNHAKIARVREFLKQPLAYQLQCLGTNANGSPKHPLMVPYAAELREWE